MREGTHRVTFLCVPSLIPKDKNAFHWEPGHFFHMHDKTKVSCIFEIQILSFMTLTLFARILGDSLYLSKYAQKGRGHKNKMCVFTIRETFVLSSICQKS